MVVVDDQRDRVYVTWTTVPNDTDAISYIAVSEDGGATFSEPKQIGLEVDGTKEFWTVPRVAEDGTLFLAWTHWQMDILTDPEDPYSNAAWTYVTRSNDGGKSFSEPVLVEADRPAEAHYYMSMAISPDARDVSISWFNYTATVPTAADGIGRDATTMWVATSHDGGQTFGEPLMISSGACVCCMPAGIWFGGSPAFVFRDWAEGDDQGDPRNPAMVTSTDGGDTWAEPVTIHDDNFYLSECPHVGFGGATDPEGGVSVSWWTGRPDAPGYYYSSSSDGKNFSEPVKLADQEVTPHENAVALGVDGNGNVWVSTVEPAAAGEDLAEQAADSVTTVWMLRDGAPPEAVHQIRGIYPQMDGTEDGVVLIWWQGTQLMAQRLQT